MATWKDTLSSWTDAELVSELRRGEDKDPEIVFATLSEAVARLLEKSLT